MNTIIIILSDIDYFSHNNQSKYILIFWVTLLVCMLVKYYYEDIVGLFHKTEYSLSFSEAMKILVEGGFVRHDGMSEGVYLKMKKLGDIVYVDTYNKYKESSSVIFVGKLYTKKYKKVALIKETK